MSVNNFHALSYLLIIFCAVSFKASAEDAQQKDLQQNRTPMEWLSLMQSAAMENDYRGTFVFSRGPMLSTVQVVHRYDNGVEQERLTQLDGEMGEVIRNGTEVMCVLPENRVVKLEKDAFSNKVLAVFSEFMPDHEMYALEVAGFERLIGRHSVEIAVRAVDEHRYSYRLWLDRDTGFLLKSVLHDIEGKELEQFRYTNLELPAKISDEELSPLRQGDAILHKMISSPGKDQNWPTEMLWDLSWVPQGFSSLGRSSQPGQNVLVYSDGLATFSVFVEAVDDQMMPEGASMVGATVAYHQRVMTGKHHYAVTVMGEIPAMTAMKLAKSVKPVMKYSSQP